MPPGWCAVALGDTGVFVNGLAFKPTDWGKSGRPIIRIQNLSGVSGDYNFTALDYPADNIADSGDLLVSWSATLDTFVWEGAQGVVNQHIFKVVPNANAVTRGFLYWLLKHEVRQLAQSQHAHGLAMMHINRGPFLAHTVLLPPLAEQDRLVAKVDELMALCDQMERVQSERDATRDALTRTSLGRLGSIARDGAIESADVRFFLQGSSRMITTPEHVVLVRKTIIDLALTGRLVEPLDSDGNSDDLLAAASDARRDLDRPRRKRTQRVSPATVAGHVLPALPRSWRWARLDEIADIVGGVTKDAKKQSLPRLVEVPYLRVANVQRGYLNLERVTTIKVPEETATSLQLIPGDILFNEGGDRDKLGRGWIWEGQITACIHQNHVFRARLFAPIIDPRLVSWHGNSFGQQWFIEGGKQTTNLASLNKTTLSVFPVPIPPLPQQHRIVAKVEELMAVCDELEGSLVFAQKERGGLLEAVLHEALDESDDRSKVAAAFAGGV